MSTSDTYLLTNLYILLNKALQFIIGLFDEIFDTESVIA